MANKKMFKAPSRGKTPVPATTINEAGGRAFSLPDKHALAQLAATGTLNDTFYTGAAEQLRTVLDLLAKNDPEFIAKAAVYVREQGRMKDMPALMCAYLTTRAGSKELLKKVFPRIMNNGKMLRNFVQIMRSGQVGRKSLGTGPRQLVRDWFSSRSDETIFRMSVGNDPSMGDVIKMIRPKPETATRRSLYAYLAGYDKVTQRDAEGNKLEGIDLLLPELVLEYERFKKAKATDSKVKLPLPKVPWEMLEGLSLADDEWSSLALQASWTQTRMNLNTFQRHGVFKDKNMVKVLASRLRDKALIEKVKPFPYQLLTAYTYTLPERDVYGHFRAGETSEIPREISGALQDAMELATANVPVFDGVAVVCVDVSGSMRSPVTGHREGSTTKMRVVDVAALIASVFLRKNPETRVLPFEHQVVSKVHLNNRDSIMTNADKLASIGGGGTDCSAPLRLLNKEKAKADLLLFVSDYESWVDSARSYGYGGTTGVLAEWNAFKARNPKAKMVCIDIQPNKTVQAPDAKSEILNIGGFSDSVFEQVSRFIQGTLPADHWIGVIDAIDLGPNKVEAKEEEPNVEGP